MTLKSSINNSAFTSKYALCLALMAVGFIAPCAQADENNFGYAYGSETLPKGHSEIYQWITYRTGKAGGNYRAVDYQTEFEHGFTDQFQASIYLNAISHKVENVPGFTNRNQFAFNGAQVAFKYSLLSPYKDDYGLAFYVEPGYKRYSRKSGKREDIYFLEGKLLHQKNYRGGAVTWVNNLTVELEREHDIPGDSWGTELELKYSTGISYRIAPAWHLGVEALVTSAFEAAKLTELGEYAVFVGPNIHYGAQRWWFTLTLLPQLSGWPSNSGERNLNNFEKIETRLKVGLNF
ncbi:MAG: hypothetical protein K9M98_05375 [Cephaloticoccus sp.]|nr:hypothetical protein [Cephaloticoccus sp.]MCF7759914.1 hypothetical protein [Cephaloticoccus sp.]